MAENPFVYRTGPFIVSVRTRIAAVRERLAWCYGAVRVDPTDSLIQFNLALHPVRGWRRFLAPQAVFRYEHRQPFEPYPLDHGFPLLEWGTNWCIGGRGNQFLMLHAGVVERGGFALLLPAIPGSGKTTLTVALAAHGWRFLSDEFALVDLVSTRVHPLPRAAPLKNASIHIIREFAPALELGPVYSRTRKGMVAHVRPPPEALARQQESAWPAWVVFPRWGPGQAVRLEPLPAELAFTRLAHNAFNYQLLGAAAFTALSRLVSRCACFSADYGDLQEMVAALDDLAPR